VSGPASSERPAARRREQVIAAVLAAQPTLTPAQVQAALTAVASHPAALRSLAEALRADPDALATGAPPVVGQLILALRAGGAAELGAPSCATCAREGMPLTRSVTGKGVCARCRRGELAEACVRCGIVKPVAGRDSERRPVCARCADRPQRTCGRCGRVRRIARRAHGDQPDLCDGCYQMPTAQCSRCGRSRPCSFAASAAPICTSCAPRRVTACARCGQLAPPSANWPEGPVCDPCYTAALRQRGTCSGCHTNRRLVEPAGPDATRCADCAGVPVTHACSECGLEDKLYERGRCQRCALRRRTGELLRGGGEQIPTELIGVHDAIINTPIPRSALNWLRKGAGARLLAELASGALPCTHQALDEHPQARAADYLRHVLVAGGALPERDEALIRLESWVGGTLLADIARAEHRRLLQAYATWRVLRRLRRRAADTPRARTATSYPRTQLLTARAFLSWLDQQGLTLRDCRQTHLDDWLAQGPASYPVRDFLQWAAQHGHCTTLLIPALGRSTGAAIDGDQRWTLLARLLHDDTLDLTDRVAGALLLCYGQQLSRIAVMTTDQIHRHHDHLTVRFGSCDITVPEPLAGLLTDLLDSGRRYVGIGTPSTPSRWLFPGHLPGRPITPSRLGERLRILGVRALPGRRATLLQLAAEVPAAVLADLLHLHPGTATRWTRDAGGDWSRYAASLALAAITNPAE
jgi:hypothetical protein